MIIKPLSSIAKNISSGLTPLRSNPLFWVNPTVPWLKTEQLGNKYIFDTKEYISEEAVKKNNMKIFPKNTLSIAMYGEGKTRGNLSILKTEMATNQACCNIEIDPEYADFEYVYYFLKTQYQNIRNLSSGIRKNLNSNDIKNYLIYLPDSKQEQVKISSVLMLIDQKIELNNRINAELEAMAKTLYDYWFVQFDFPNEDGKPYKSSGGKMVYNSILKREIPVMFSEGVLDNLGQIVGGSTPDTKDCDNFCIKGVPWITPNDLSNNQGNKYISKGEKNVSDKGIKSASLKKYPLGTVLLTSRAPIGYMAIARKEFTTNQGFKSFIPNKGYPTDFVYFTIKNSLSIIIQFASGSTFKEISTTVLKTVPIVLPPLHIVKDFTNKIDSLTKQQNILEQECSELRNLRDWLLPMLMNGQVTVK